MPASFLQPSSAHIKFMKAGHCTCLMEIRAETCGKKRFYFILLKENRLPHHKGVRDTCQAYPGGPTRSHLRSHGQMSLSGILRSYYSCRFWRAVAPALIRKSVVLDLVMIGLRATAAALFMHGDQQHCPSPMMGGSDTVDWPRIGPLLQRDLQW